MVVLEELYEDDIPKRWMVGVRAPMQEAEKSVVRPDWLKNDIEAALAAAVEAGGDVAHPPMEIPGHCTLGGTQYGLWQR